MDMSELKCISVGVQLPTDGVEFVPLLDKRSLLDFDLILFCPNYAEASYIRWEEYEGKKLLPRAESAVFRDQVKYWRNELLSAFRNGKFVVIYLSEFETFFYYNGKKEVKSSSRNASVTNFVEESGNYAFLPISDRFISTKGKEMRLSASGNNFFNSYWSQFGSISEYRVLFEGETSGEIITKFGEKVCGRSYCDKSGGRLVALPFIDFWSSKFTEERKGKLYFTSYAKQTASSLIASLISMAKLAASQKDSSAEPVWGQQLKLKTKRELSLIDEISFLESQHDEIRQKLDDRRALLTESNWPRSLLFESGAILEKAVRDSLSVLGFTGESFRSGDLEIDAIFYDADSRYVGEVEGKDNSQVNVNKFRQLMNNIAEDLHREEVDRAAKGVLFGNAYRFTNPDERELCFSDKCIRNAESHGYALVDTRHLFEVVKYILDSDDNEFASKCRQAFKGEVGLLSFPQIPEA